MKKLLIIAALIAPQAFAQPAFDPGSMLLVIPKNQYEFIATGLTMLDERGEMNWWGSSDGGELKIEKTGTVNGKPCKTFRLSIWTDRDGFKDLVKPQTLSACFANGKWSVLF